eukprot:1040452-Karenia_brevis.AAC.1
MQSAKVANSFGKPPGLQCNRLQCGSLGIWLDGVTKDIMPYSAVIESCAKAGNWRQANEGLEKAIEEGKKSPKLKPGSSAYNAVIEACAKAGEHELAEKWLATIDNLFLFSHVGIYNAVINACAKAGDFKRAEQWLAKADEKFYAQAQNTLFGQAASSFNRPCSETYNAVINACAKGGQCTIT